MSSLICFSILNEFCILGLIKTFLPHKKLKNTPASSETNVVGGEVPEVAIQLSLLYDVTSVFTCYKYFEYHKTFKSTNIINMRKKICIGV